MSSAGQQSSKQYQDKSSNPGKKTSESAAPARDKLVGVGQPGDNKSTFQKLSESRSATSNVRK